MTKGFGILQQEEQLMAAFPRLSQHSYSVQKLKKQKELIFSSINRSEI